MKKLTLTFLSLLAFALCGLGQTPTLSPTASLIPSPAPAVVATPVPAISAPTATATVTRAVVSDADEDLDSAIEKKIRKHFNISMDRHHSGGDDTPWIAIPIVFIVFLALFGTPVLIVGLIMYFSFSKSRALHRTVRMMVEKGQPVPEALLNPPPVMRQRSDLRRGVILLMVGFGLMIFFGAVNDWQDGVWSLGIIPFLIGAGYLLVWRLDMRKADATAAREDASPRV